MKPNSSYRMSKENKNLISQIMDPHERGEIKRIFIEADLIAAIKPKRDKKAEDQADDQI